MIYKRCGALSSGSSIMTKTLLESAASLAQAIAVRRQVDRYHLAAAAAAATAAANGVARLYRGSGSTVSLEHSVARAEARSPN